MDATHVHLALTHFPIIGTIIGTLILAYGQFSKNDIIKKVALALFVSMAILTVPVFLSGEEAEETVEKIAGVSESLMEEHEELAEKAIWLMGLLGVLSAIGFYAIAVNWSFSKTITLITLVVALATCGVFAKVGNLGGQIRHSEIRAAGFDSASGSTSVQVESGDEEEDNDDD